jgi:hypothetical protein
LTFSFPAAGALRSREPATPGGTTATYVGTGGMVADADGRNQCATLGWVKSGLVRYLAAQGWDRSPPIAR